MIDWLNAHKSLFAWIGFGSALAMLTGLLIVPLLVIFIPSDYFCRGRVSLGVALPGLVGAVVMVVKNIIGVAILLLGVAMLVLPGQGILTILLGLVLVDLPGKHTLLVRLAKAPRVRRAMNWLRTRSGRPPLRFEP
jgi:hypothetical protein